MNREDLVKRVIMESYRDIVGGYENAVLDGNEDEMPPEKELKAAVYRDVMNTSAVWTKQGRISVSKDVRFLGTDHIKELIDERFIKDFDERDLKL